MINQLLWLVREINYTETESEDSSYNECEKAVSDSGWNATLKRSSDSTFRGGINFTLYQANGGYILSNTSYDMSSDIRRESLHVITADEDLGEAIARIVTFEGLRNIGR